MKKFPVVFMFLFASIIFGQQEISTHKKITTSGVKVTSISYTVDNIEALKTIDWKHVKEAFEINKPKEIIEMTFGLDFKKSKNKFKSSFKVSGESKNIDSLIIKAKKGVKSIIKISKKHQNN
ncbi:hypothetical protein [uncultured Polaribacter sp.]|uniref:hypothetical protein n=1 Tax=uncultured Polaribacter sp. TaxID=174711 RepID=UPI00261F4243|nr:hypothetical protein [uncultured Polaribacter sp.]